MNATRPPSPNALAEALSEKSADAFEERLDTMDDARFDAKVEWIQTHISHVFLVGSRVFKLRKSVRMPFLDFTSLAERNADCLREIELNRRLAPDVYLGVAPIVAGPEGPYVGPVTDRVLETSCEHFVVMRRLERERDAQTLLANHGLGPEHLESVAARIARFHDEVSLGRPAPFSRDAWFDRTAEPIRESLEAIDDSGFISHSRVETLRTEIEDRLTRLRPVFEARRVAGRAVDGHGDLRLDHIWFENDDARQDPDSAPALEPNPIVIDCIEFNEELRHIDRASEVAFLAMDLRYRNAPMEAESFLAAYALESDDYGLFAVVDVFVGYRALVRAKVGALAAAQESVREEQREAARTSVERHFALAESVLLPSRATTEAGLVLLCGTVGSGKSTVARRLARNGGGVVIASDRVRKALAGTSATERLGSVPDQGAYSPERITAVYEALLERAAQVLASGRTALLDAGFAQRRHRDLVRDWAKRQGFPTRLLEVRCDPAIAAARVEKRAARGTDPSDAGPDFLPISWARFEAPDEWPDSEREIVWTDAGPGEGSPG